MTWLRYIENRTIVRGIIMRLNCTIPVLIHGQVMMVTGKEDLKTEKSFAEHVSQTFQTYRQEHVCLF